MKIPIYGPELIKISEGSIIFLDGNPTSPVLKELYWKGSKGYENDTHELFISFIRQSAFFLDVGANIGYYALAARALNPKIKVFAFEPLPSAFKYLQHNIGLNGFTEISAFCLALSDSNSSQIFHTRRNPKFNFISDHLVGDSSLNTIDLNDKYITPLKVECRTLDDFAKNHFGDRGPDFIKMDVEGAEDKVIQGGRQTLLKWKPVIMAEVIQGKIEEKIEELLSNIGYEFYEADSCGKLKKVNQLKVYYHKKDFFFIHSDFSHKAIF